MKIKYNEEKQQLYMTRNFFEKIKCNFITGKFLFPLRRLFEFSNVYFCRAVRSAIRYFEEFVAKPFRRKFVNSYEVIPNRVVFGTYQNAYACNCKYIADYMLKNPGEFDIIFIVSKEVYDDPKGHGIPAGVKVVKRGNIEAYYALATARYWVDNAINCVWTWIPKKEGQIYMNTWHGSLGIKKLSGGGYWKRMAAYANEVTDYFLTDSVFDEHVFHESFWPKADFLKVGHPRNDMFFDKELMQQLKDKVYEYYGIDKDARLFMYAPTFRDNTFAVDAINMDFAMVQKALEQRFGGKWVMMSRLHYHNAQDLLTRDTFAKLDNLIDASLYPDMQELMCAADIGVTDYSSWIFDYIFTGRPAFIYAEDIEMYVNSRGFYYSLNETPYDVSDSSEKLCQAILAFDQDAFDAKVEKFLEGKGCYEAGHACQGVVDFMRNPPQGTVL